MLVEPKDAFVHNIGRLAPGRPRSSPKIFLPYDQLLAHGRVVRDQRLKWARTRRGGVGRGDPADYIVLEPARRTRSGQEQRARAEDAIDNYRGPTTS